MNPPKVHPSVSPEPPTPQPSLLFMIVLFAVAVAVGGAIIYLGVNGMIGGPIP